jgi:hypothetical protein
MDMYSGSLMFLTLQNMASIYLYPLTMKLAIRSRLDVRKSLGHGGTIQA